MYKATPSPPGLLLLTSFLLHVKEDRASPTRLVCDNRLIQKYIVEAKDMEKRAVSIQSPTKSKSRDPHSSWCLTLTSLLTRASARPCLHSAALQCCPWWTSLSSSGNPNR